METLEELRGHAFQQQLRQEMADVIQQLRVEVNETVSGRIDKLNSINAVSAKPLGSKPYRISDFIPRHWEGSNEKGSIMSDLHLWMQPRSNQGGNMLVSVESTNKFDSCTISFDRSDEEFWSIEASLYQVLDRTTAKRTTESSPADKTTEGVRSVVRDRKEIRSEE